MPGVLVFLEPGVAVIFRLARRICLSGGLNLFVAGERRRITGKRGEHGQGDDASQRPQALVHSVIPREPNGMSHEIARSVRLELNQR
jgi:hypothetical protein